MEEFLKPYNPKEVEEKIYKIWEKSGFFNPDKLPRRKIRNLKLEIRNFCIMLPPPNITGSLHLGHALNATIQDILIRRRRMQGYKTLWLPGTDHAGIATQNVVEKELKKQGLTRYELGREKFLARVWQWKEKYGHIILDQLKKIGASCDWSRARFTLDEDYVKAVETAFLHYYKKGWIYQGKRPVNWCSRCETSLSDLELEYKENKGKLYYIRYPLYGSSTPIDYVVVATTRPESMLGDAAVAVNSKDKRYKNLIGEKVELPLVNRKIPIVVDEAIDPKFGTGAVKVTPAHDFTDFEISLRHKLSIYEVISEKGRIINAGKYNGMKVMEAREAVMKDLESLGLIEKIEDYTHSRAHCYRCENLIEPLVSLQWFLKMDHLAKLAIKAVRSGRVKIHPKSFEKLYFEWLGNTKDWCVSRQIWWGHQLPIWQCQIGSKSKIKNQKSKIHIEANINKPTQKCVGGYEWERVPDVLDTWFSSALWPFVTLKGSDLKKFYPTQVLVTDRGIINLWVGRMIFSGLEFMGKEPFRDVYINPTVLTKEGKRMSKSLGTGIDPLDLIEKYGADALRFGLIWQNMGNQDMRFSEEHIVAGRKFCNKIWNASRFVLTQSGNPKSKILNPKTKADKQILKELQQTIKEVDKRIEKFQFGQALHDIYDFFWHSFCDKYIEETKNQKPKTKNQVLFYVLANSLKLLHPFMPFITEEIWSKLPPKASGLIIIEKWPN